MEYANIPSTGSGPQGPIVVLGRKKEFLYVMATPAQAVTYVNLYLSSLGKVPQDESMPQDGRLTLDEIEFFDALGRRLVAVAPDAEISDLIVEPDLRTEIRERVRSVLQAVEDTVEERPDAAELRDRVPQMPSDDLTFEEFLDTLLKDEKMDFDPLRHCQWILRVLRLCG